MRFCIVNSTDFVSIPRRDLRQSDFRFARNGGASEGEDTNGRVPDVTEAIATITACALMLSGVMQSALACTGITLKAADGSVLFGRTLEWGSFDLKSRLVVIPRGYKYVTHMPDGKPGLSWQGHMAWWGSMPSRRTSSSRG